MSEHELEKLLGGFAADQLTAEERQQLYTAALQDQQLFNALADEQALKELLADPAVKQRLLRALNHASPSTAGGSLSWLDWFRRPANLALAGGLATAVFAVVLGTKVYQESLKQTAPSVTTEEAKSAAPPAQAPATSQPASPSLAEPPMKAKENVATPATAPPPRVSTDKLSRRERSSAIQHFEEQRASDTARDAAALPMEQDLKKQTAPLVQEQASTKDEVALLADRQQTAGGPAAAPVPAPMQTPAADMTGKAAEPQLSARALFYGEPARTDASSMTQEKEQAMRPLSESVQQFGGAERKKEQFALAGKAAGTVAQLKPLGLRYSFVARGTDGQDRPIVGGSLSGEAAYLRLILEANQDSYLQVWKTTGPATTRLVFPDKDSGQISFKLAAGQRQNIPVPSERGTLTIRLARVPFGPITRQESMLLDRPTAGQLHETIQAEQATYVVNQDRSPTGQITVEIPPAKY